MKIYSPCKNTLEFKVDGRKVYLPPGITNMLKSEGKMAVAQFKHWGVCALPRYGGKEAQKQAQETWMHSNKEWAEGVLMTWHEDTKEKKEAGIPLEEPEDVVTARNILGGV